MRKSVEAAWYPSIKSYEGYTNWLYFDTHKPPLATTGVGNMIDTGSGLSAFGLALPWRFENGTYATEAQIKQEYTRLKNLGISNQGGYAYEKHAKLFLDESVVKWMVMLKTNEFWSTLARTFPDIEEWPADAQLAIMNMAWWMGPAFTQSWPTLTAALKAQDFAKASKNCTTVNPSERNPHNVRRFQNAANVVASKSDREKLWDTNYAPAPKTVITVSAALAASAKPNYYSIDAKRVQEMLARAGFYSTTIDGLFGNMSKEAFKLWAQAAKVENRINKETLTVLSNQTTKYKIVT